MPQIRRLIIFSILLGCAGVPRPDTDLCVANVPAKHRKCYNLLRDYDDNGNLRADAKPTFKPLVVLADINKNIMTDPRGLGNLKAYIQKLRNEAASRCQ